MNLSMNTSTAVFLSVLYVSIVYLVKDSTDKGCSIRCTRDNNGKGAVSKWLKQAMRGSAFFRNIFGQTKTECRKNGTQGIIFIRNSKWNEL